MRAPIAATVDSATEAALASRHTVVLPSSKSGLNRRENDDHTNELEQHPDRRAVVAGRRRRLPHLA
ncbi:hypothetical protein MSMEI_2832 [Mycolicibacterium smegmatis MC2 155]|uniref:Uncharacterized protein n=1 Tax=Mycolicibacterium smegmatis (strain ATCC 700084 / mc(2)155) TaxID=246196 RepID=I7G7S1_MYCS2|nr:hypothetical protein MSMEI_2832 [Mycolicibacterium smegmatis MC2 155]